MKAPARDGDGAPMKSNGDATTSVVASRSTGVSRGPSVGPISGAGSKGGSY